MDTTRVTILVGESVCGLIWPPSTGKAENSKRARSRFRCAERRPLARLLTFLDKRFIVLIGWRWRDGGDPQHMATAAVLVTLLFGLVGAWLVRFWRREQRRRSTLEALAEQLDRED